MNQIDRNRFASVRALRRLHDSAVRVAQGAGIASSESSSISTVAAAESAPDANGNTIEALGFWNLDKWNLFYWG